MRKRNIVIITSAIGMSVLALDGCGTQSQVRISSNPTNNTVSRSISTNPTTNGTSSEGTTSLSQSNGNTTQTQGYDGSGNSFPKIIKMAMKHLPGGLVNKVQGEAPTVLPSPVARSNNIYFKTLTGGNEYSVLLSSSQYRFS